MSKTDDILRVLNDLEPLDVDNLKFSVISDAGSHAVVAGNLVDTGEPRFWPFQQGEVIINDGHGGREPFGEGRKPNKWDVAEESFDTLDEALECRRKVLAGEWPRRYK